MRQRTNKGLFVALLLLVLGLGVPLSRAMGQEGNPTAAASDSPAAMGSASNSPAAMESASGSPAAMASTSSPAPSTSGAPLGAVPTATTGGKTPVVLIDGAGNGVVHTVDIALTSKGSKANLTGGMNVGSGLGVVTARLSIPDAKDGKGQGYLEANGKKIFGVGTFNVTLQPQDKNPNLDLNFSVKQDGASSTATGKLSLDVASDKDTNGIASMSLDGDGSLAGYKTSQTNLHFTMGGNLVKGQIASSFKAADIKITEAQGVTTIVSTITVPGASQMASAFKQLSATPSVAETQIKTVLESKGINVQSVKLSNVHSTADEAGAVLTISIKDLRKTLQTLLRAGLAQKSADMGIDPAVFEKSVDELLQLQLDNFDISATTSGDKFDAKLTINASNVDKFVLGYIDIYTALIPSLQKMQPSHKQTPMNQLVLQANVITLQHLRTVWEQSTANSSDKSQFKFAVAADLSNNHVKVTGNLDGSADIKSFVQAAKANNYPMMDSQYVLVKAKSDTKAVIGSFYVDASGTWFDALKAPYAEAARSVKGMEELATILPDLQFNDARMALDLGGGDLNGNGYVQLSDLSPVVKAALAKNAPNFKGEVVAVNFTSDNATGNSATNMVDMFLSGLPKTEADVKSDLGSLGSLGSLDVKMASDPGQTKPPTLNKPNVEIPADLKVAADDSRKELGISSLPIPGVPGGKPIEGSQTNMLLLVAGIVLVVGVAVFAVGKGGKKS